MVATRMLALAEKVISGGPIYGFLFKNWLISNSCNLSFERVEEWAREYLKRERVCRGIMLAMSSFYVFYIMVVMRMGKLVNDTTPLWLLISTMVPATILFLLVNRWLNKVAEPFASVLIQMEDGLRELEASLQIKVNETTEELSTRAETFLVNIVESIKTARELERNDLADQLKNHLRIFYGTFSNFGLITKSFEELFGQQTTKK